jgi:C4-dicarboxylate-specific signal transduction histidine kinase
MNGAGGFWDRHLLLVIVTGALLLLQAGLIVALVLQSRRHRRAEREVRRRREELAHMTRVATVGELTASLAHEINQPLAAILANAQAARRLLASGSASMDEIAEILDDITADDQRAGEIIRRMRAMLRQDAPSPETLDMNDLVVEVSGLLHGEMILQDVALTMDLSAVPPMVHGDRIQLQQVLLNFMVNALDAMKDLPGPAHKTIACATAVADHDVRVSVQDSGAGVAADKLEQIFEPFMTTKPHGMGLGLSICRSIVQAHGGRIGLTPNGGRGVTFWFTVPTAEVKA